MSFLFMLILSAVDQELQVFRQNEEPYAMAFAPDAQSANALMEKLINHENYTPDKVRTSVSSYSLEIGYRLDKTLYFADGDTVIKNFCHGKLRWTLLKNFSKSYDDIKQALFTVAELTDLILDKKPPHTLNQTPISASYIVPTTVDLSRKNSITKQDFQKISQDTEILKFVGSKFDLTTAQRLGNILSHRQRPLQILNLRDTNLNLEMLQKILPQDTSAGLVNNCWYYAQKLATWSNFVNWSISWQLMPLQLVLPINHHLAPYNKEFDAMVAYQKQAAANKPYHNHVLKIQVLWDEAPVLKTTNDWEWEEISVTEERVLPNTLKISSETPHNEIIDKILEQRYSLENLIFYWQTYEQFSIFLIFLSGYDLDRLISLSVLRNHLDASKSPRKLHIDIDKILPHVIMKNFRQVSHLNLSGNNGDVPDFISSIGHLTFLESLTLQRCFGRDIHVRPSVRKSDQLQQLFNYLESKAWPNLKKLDIHENFLDEQEKSTLARAIEESGQEINLIL